MASERAILRLALYLAVLHLLALAAQAVLAGDILGGAGFDALHAHEMNARVVFFSCAGTAATLALGWRRRLLPGGWALAAAVLTAIEPLQFHFGYRAMLAIHVPLGVGIVAAAAVLAYGLLRRMLSAPGEPGAIH